MNDAVFYEKKLCNLKVTKGQWGKEMYLTLTLLYSFQKEITSNSHFTLELHLIIGEVLGLLKYSFISFGQFK